MERLKEMKNGRIEGLFHHVRHLISLLKTCADNKDLCKGSKLHAYAQEHKLLDRNSYVASNIINMYAKCGEVWRAKQVQAELPVRDMVMWTALMAGYAQHGQGEEALECFDNMQADGHSPDEITFTCALKACRSIGAVGKGEQIHEKIVSLGMLGKNIVLGTTLVDMYARSGALSKAHQVLEELPVRDIVMWTALIAGYVQQGQGAEALKCFDCMQCEGHSPNAVTFTCALKACGSIGAVVKGKQIHDKILGLGMLEKDPMLGSTLVDMYARCAALAKAQQVLEELPSRNVVTWTALIAGYAQHEQGEEALKCFDNMQREGHFPNMVTFICALKACGSIVALAKGEQIHDAILSLGMLEKNVVLGSALVGMYARCGALLKAKQVFEELPVQDTVMWTALIAGYVQQGQGEEALKCFDGMLQEGLSPDAVAFTCALKACGIVRAAAKGEQIHQKIMSLGMLDKHVMLGSTLVEMYSKCGLLPKAEEVLEQLPVRNEFMWTAIIAGYIEQGQGEEALKCFDSMEGEGHIPSVFTLSCALKACGSIGAAARGEQVHEKILSLGMLENDDVLASILVDMYAKCAALPKAQQVLEELFVQDVVAWTALVAGYGLQGQSAEALSCFDKMQFKGVKPNSTTLTCVLNACSHSGRLDQAEMFFSQMSIEYGIMQDVEHYCCMVDLFGRAGKFTDALLMIEKMPSSDHLEVWVALLGACRKWGDVNIGRFAFDCALRLNKSEVKVYICMAYIYTAAGMQAEADKVEVMRVANKAMENASTVMFD